MAPSAHEFLRLVQVATFGALAAAVSAEIGAALAAERTDLARLVTPPVDALHPFLPVFVGMLVLPVALAGLAFALERVYRTTPGTTDLARPFAKLAVAIYGAVPIYLASLFLPVPGGSWIAGVGVALSVVAWSTGYRRVLGVPAGHGAQLLGISVLAALGVLPMFGALLATLA